MGARQKAVAAFFAVCDDETMLDRWIPDEDWVRQIRDNGEIDCSVMNFNMGMSKHCMWQNNHSTQEGRMLFYNNRRIRISKTKVTKKIIRFYYVLGAGKPAPTIPSDQDFYQSLWDDRERSNRSLKRTAPSARTQPPTKKAKSPSTMPIPPEPIPPEPLGNQPLPQSPTDSFKEAIGIDLKKGVRDIQLGNGVVVLNIPNRYEIVVDSDLARFRRERGLVAALKDVLNRKYNQPTQHTKHLLAAFAASHPQISVMYQELLISLARYTFLLEVKASVEYSGKAKGVDVSFFNLDNVSNSSPCSTSLTNWVIELARDQVLIFSRKVDDCNLFCRSDGGQKGQEVRLFRLLDESYKS